MSVQNADYAAPRRRSRPLALDLFCCGGGVSMGLHQAGFSVVGIWLPASRLAEAIPPAYSELIGRAALAAMTTVEAA